MAVAAIAVAGLVAWALTRTVQAPVVTTDTAAATAQFPTTTVPTSGTAATTGTEGAIAPLPTNTAPPLASGTATGTFTPPVSATSTPPPPSALEGERSDVRRISAEDLRERLNSGSVVVVDVRDAASFATGHIAGALHIPFSSIQTQVDTLPRGKEIVTYCT